MPLYIVFLTLFGMLFLLTSCASTAAVEPQGPPVEQVPTVEIVPEVELAAPVAEQDPQLEPVVEVPPAPPASACLRCCRWTVPQGVVPRNRLVGDHRVDRGRLPALAANQRPAMYVHVCTMYHMCFPVVL